MSSIYLSMLTALVISMLGILLFRNHLMSTLLCIEGMMLSLFITITITALSMNYTLLSTTPIILLVFAACEAAIGLALLVMVSNSYGSDYVQNLNLLQC